MNLDLRPLRELTTARQKPAGIERVAALRDAGEALAERLRGGRVDGLEPLSLGTIALESSAVLGGWRPASGLALARRRAWLVRAGGTRVLCDPAGIEGFFATPYGERLAQRHPLRARAIAGRSLRDALAELGTRPEDVGIVVLTHLRFVSVPALLEALPAARIVVGERELAAARSPSAWQRPFLDRRPLERHERLVITRGDALVLGALALVETPGLTEGTLSVAASVGGRVRVLSAHGLTRDAWTPYESRLRGLREAVRLRDVEVMPRGDAENAALSTESMILERAIADRDGALHAIDPWAELLPMAAFLRG